MITVVVMIDVLAKLSVIATAVGAGAWRLRQRIQASATAEAQRDIEVRHLTDEVTELKREAAGRRRRRIRG
jgi:hypothetical protein